MLFYTLFQDIIPYQFENLKIVCMKTSENSLVFRELPMDEAECAIEIQKALIGLYNVWIEKDYGYGYDLVLENPTKHAANPNGLLCNWFNGDWNSILKRKTLLLLLA